jgi:hypothetical protein
MRGEKTMMPNIRKGIVNKHYKPRRWNSLLAFIFLAVFLSFFCLSPATNAYGSDWMIRVISSPGGTTEPDGGFTDLLDDGTNFEAQSFPVEGYYFVEWKIDHYSDPLTIYKTTTSAANPLIITVEEDLDITPIFALTEYTLDVTSSGGTGGAADRVTKSPAQPPITTGHGHAHGQSSSG